MVGKTHLQIGLASTITAETVNKFAKFTDISFLSPFCILGVIAGSLLPDIDNDKSIISGVFPITSRIITNILKLRHRGFCHSLIFSALYYFAYMTFTSDIRMFFLGLCIGNTLHILSDAFVSKTQILFPIYWRGMSLLHFEGQPDKYQKADKIFSYLSSAILILSVVVLGTFYIRG